ncbi:hypothetical protein MAPG_10573 [Magnaporthiopsis poae ATCC 64411]|uniref:Uncharacterized protein n=1 Tax=Magnaporthiopsis poae (strain ATCC 64411 / 73-15) TaxID=644358 RepID=A0A0C4ECY4_MAGP6|nr:hypothetical protein MAPG_10573 [Magnaporthiopsis poae ATCC 64411]
MERRTGKTFNKTTAFFFHSTKRMQIAGLSMSQAARSGRLTRFDTRQSINVPVYTGAGFIHMTKISGSGKSVKSPRGWRWEKRENMEVGRQDGFSAKSKRVRRARQC